MFRSKSPILSLVALATLALPATAQDSASRITSAAAPTTPPAGLDADAWRAVRQDIRVHQHAVRPHAEGFRARNPRQGWTTVFDGRGFEVRPDVGGWTFGLELESYGVEGDERAVDRTIAMRADGGRVSYDWDQRLTEWYVNDQRGVEHGYTLASRPEGDVGAPLAFRLSIRGELQPVVHADGRGLALVDDRGRTLLDYAGLVVFDATGRFFEAGFALDGDDLLLSVDAAQAQYPLTIDPIVEQAYLKASNVGAEDLFGFAVAADGDTLAVGAFRESSDATGVDGDAASNASVNAGAVYIFVRDGSSWTQQAYIKASNSDTEDEFGIAVALDGDTLVIGAHEEDSSSTGVGGDETDDSAIDSGAAYVFTRTRGTWTQQAYLKASNTGAFDRFGSAVAVSGDTVVVAAQDENSGATGIGGNEADNSAPNSGAVYVFTRSSGTWTQQAYLKASNADALDYFGVSLAIDGERIVVGARGERSSGAGQPLVIAQLAFDSTTGTLYATDTFSTDQLITIDPSTGAGTAIGSGPGALGFFDVTGLTFDATTGTLFGTDITTDELITIDPITGVGSAVGALGFGFVVGLAFDGATGTLFGTDTDTDQLITIDPSTGVGTAVGALGFDVVADLAFDATTGTLYGTDPFNGQLLTIDPNTGAATAVGSGPGALGFGSVSGLAFDVTTGTLYGADFPSQLITIDPSTGIGTAVAALELGPESNNSAPSSGAAYVFERAGTTWSQSAYLKASNTDPGDAFGSSISLSGSTLVCGAPFEDSNGQGSVGSPGDNSTSGAGAAYVFQLLGSTWTQTAYLKSFDAGEQDRFGIAVALEDDRLCVGATGNDSAPISVVGLAFQRLTAGDGTFGVATDFAAGILPTSVAVGDLDGDGRLDLVTSNRGTNDVSVLLGAGDGTFGTATAFAVGTVPLSVAIGDLDGDGALDLVTANFISDDVSVLLGAGDGTFGVATAFAAGAGPSSVAIGDLDGDGALDLVTANLDSDDVSVLLGVGDGTFGTAQAFAAGDGPSSVAIGDLDGNGGLDLVTANLISNDVSVLLGAGDGTFGVTPALPVGAQPTAVAVGDLDGDGDLDLVTANSQSGSLSVLFATAPGVFTPAPLSLLVGAEPRAVAIDDLNGDGIADLVTANTSSNDVGVLLGTGFGTFGAQSIYPAGPRATSLAIADLNADGALDIAASSSIGDRVSVLLGTPPSSPVANLFSIVDGSGELVAIDPTTGEATVVGPTGFFTIFSLAFDPTTSTLYGADVVTAELVAIDVTTGGGSVVGNLGFAEVIGLAFDAVTGTLYGTDADTDQLLVIDPATGAGTAVGPLGFDGVAGLAFDSTTGTLYGTNVFTNELIAIDPATGAGTAIGDIGFGEGSPGLAAFIGFAFDPLNGVLYGADFDTGQLLTIDTTSGAGTAVGPILISNQPGLSDSGAVICFEHVGGEWKPTKFLKADNPDAGDRFGSALAMSGSTLVVGAPFEASGLVAQPTDNSAPNAGAAYAFDLPGGPGPEPVAAASTGRRPGSLLVYPVQRSALGNSAVFTVVSVTNTNRNGAGATDVHFQYVNVAASSSPFLFADCTIADRVESLTPADTLSVLTSCHNSAAAGEGYLVVTALDPDEVDTSWSFNHLVGSEQIVSAGGGMYSLNAIAFGSPLGQGTDTDLDGDGRRDFDGAEYVGIAEELYIDSYIGGLAGDLVLISFLGGEYLNLVDLVIYNDNEYQLSGQFSFACWARVPLAQVSGFFTPTGLQSTQTDSRELDVTCDGVEDVNTGWAIVRPARALSVTSDDIEDPVVLGALVNDGAPYMNARLLWESRAKRLTGQFPN